jgi:hypothetical protein
VQLLDKALRAAALVTCVAAGFAVVLMGGFAADSGTRTADLIGMAIILGVGALLLGVVLACFMKGRFATAIAYSVGCIGIGLGVLQGARVWLWGSAFQEVAPGTANYPVLNPNAVWTVQVMGELAPAVSLEYLEATYIVGFAMSDEPPECHSAASHGGLPLLHTERIDVSLSGGSYRAVVAVDKFQPGTCGWHLRDVHFQIAGAGRDATPAWINAFDQRYSLRGPFGGPESASSRVDLWCRSIGWSFKKGAVCETLAHIRPDLSGRVPAEERGESSEVWAYPSGGPVQVNFHDLDQLAAAGAGMPAG